MTVSVIIVGAGISGICAGIRLREAGCEVRILEKGNSLGGTWRDNVYPGAACDIPSHLYSFSFAPKSDWSRTYAFQAEILQYLEACVERFDIGSCIRFQCAVVSARYEEDSKCWAVTLDDGSVERANFVIWACGQLHRPNVPSFAGVDAFAGVTMHSAEWRQDVPLEGRRVAMIGNAASGVQIASAIAEQVEQLTVFQRTPNWIFPRIGGSYNSVQKSIFKWLPPMRLLRRFSQFWQQESLIFAFRENSSASRNLARISRKFMRRKIGDDRLVETLTPNYPIGCKRILLSNSYLKLFRRDNVILETAPIEKFTDKKIVTNDGVEHSADVVVFATGFRTNDLLSDMVIEGVDGASLHEAWVDGPKAHLGMTVPGFPNMFVVFGPNTGLGHNSMIFMIECQVNHICQLIGTMRNRGYGEISVNPAAFDKFNARLQSSASKTVWAGACASWYKTDEGRLTVIWPYSAARYWLRTRWPRRGDYHLR